MELMAICGIKEANRPFKTALWYGGAEYVRIARVLNFQGAIFGGLWTEENQIEKVTLDEMGQMAASCR